LKDYEFRDFLTGGFATLIILIILLGFIKSMGG